ncbi:4Fe-4S binding protein [Roseibium porphyridii]|uniref:4Fe-4S binding protein n=1 Tax=Roseibium porphyridii TaxID=2866279 RepID=A0ABY8F2T9_9HYPH|nr:MULTISPECIES: 4Fe-4S binding protein [Stappiaceae]QFT33028.1 Putative electron transport protein YccM [Labrenzia sp. THAF82]WFE88322.1 4Fe-4S binding protein [Roseibium sp. KMA01]
MEEFQNRALGCLGGLAKHIVFAAAVLLLLLSASSAEELEREEAARYIEPPYQLGDLLEGGIYELINLDGRVSGYAFETEPLAPLPGFSGAPINLFVILTLEGRLIDVDIVSHNEPIFVSGLGEAPFQEFISQYKGYSITDSLVIGVPYGDQSSGSSLVYLDGVTKATASVRIAHETLLAAALKVAREKMQGIGGRAAAKPDLEHAEPLTWEQIVEEGIAGRRVVTNREVDDAFADSIWADDDPVAKDEPDEIYLDLWVVDLGPPAIAEAILEPDSLSQLRNFQELSPDDEPILVIDAGRHGLVTEDFVRNTSPNLITASQDGLPISLRDADLDVELRDGIPGEFAMVLRTDRRLGFNPIDEWSLSVRAVREHGSFRPEIGTVDFTVAHKTDERFFIKDEPPAPVPVWRQAMDARSGDLVVLAGGLAALVPLLLLGQSRLAGFRQYTLVRLAILAGVIGFVGWWGQGQLSIATVLGVVRSLFEGQSLAFLLYDPFSLLIWGVVLLTFVIWGRGFFCGWMCPFGAMQEFMHYLGRLLRLPQIQVPDRIDFWLVKLKYVILAGLLALAILAPTYLDTAIEVEPFKTAITTFFVREWYFVLYCVGLLLLSMVVFKGFCRYICPLGAVMAIGGFLRLRDWIPRRDVCGSPCQLCRVKCNYNAIKPTGGIKYDECFQCLDCVTIHDDDNQCVPLILAKRGRQL